MQTELQIYLDRKRKNGGRAQLDVSAAELASICDALEERQLIDALRAEEGHEIAIIHDNPDFAPSELDCAVAWAKSVEEYHQVFHGETVLIALRKAHAAMTGEFLPPEDRDHVLHTGAPEWMLRAWRFVADKFQNRGR